mmetsp:Transcript_5774/g.10331  ORF Transcript_5774/g.10331 Transcript_5774/m.10331 type:complete len:85 (-) Transcript_5774:270-524(-)
MTPTHPPPHGMDAALRSSLDGTVKAARVTPNFWDLLDHFSGFFALKRICKAKATAHWLMGRAGTLKFAPCDFLHQYLAKSFGPG